MHVYQLYITALILLFSLNAGAASTPLYKPGQMLAFENKELVARENGQWLNVPVDYSHPEGPTLPLYYHFAGGYDPVLPTIVIFTGGPALPSHFASADYLENWVEQIPSMGFNVLLFDQRGVAFSRPNDQRQYHDPDTYSSIATARDVEQLRQALHIDQLTIYGKSYGTIAATIYASLFAVQTRALILEGVLAMPHSDEYAQNPYPAHVLRDFLRSLSPAALDLVRSYSAKCCHLALAYSIPLAVQNVAGKRGRDGIETLRQDVEAIARAPSEQQMADLIREIVLAPIEPRSIYAIDKMVHGALMNKEQGDPFSTYLAVRGEDGEVAMVDDQARQPAPLPTRYYSKDHLTTAPTYYIVGEADGATSPWLAVQHWQNARPQTATQFLLLTDGSHFVSGGLYQDSQNAVSPQFSIYLQRVFAVMARGEQVDTQAIQELNSLGEKKFTLFSDRSQLPELQEHFSKWESITHQTVDSSQP